MMLCTSLSLKLFVLAIKQCLYRKKLCIYMKNNSYVLNIYKYSICSGYLIHRIIIKAQILKKMYLDCARYKFTSLAPWFLEISILDIYPVVYEDYFILIETATFVSPRQCS